MFVGHYAAAMAAKTADPRAPLWSYFLGAQLVDIGWSALIAIGVEKARVDPSLPGSSLDLYDMPWTHSLPAAVAWSLVGGYGLMRLLKLPRRVGVFLGLTIFSHWLLDLCVHRPDLLLWIGGPKVGLALWNQPVVEQALEIGLLGIGAIFWSVQRARAGHAAWPAAGLVTFLLIVHLGAMIAPPGGGPVQMGMSALLAYAGMTFAAVLIEKRMPRASPLTRGVTVASRAKA